jgi:hypothetical protein
MWLARVAPATLILDRDCKFARRFQVGAPAVVGNQIPRPGMTQVPCRRHDPGLVTGRLRAVGVTGSVSVPDPPAVGVRSSPFPTPIACAAQEVLAELEVLAGLDDDPAAGQPGWSVGSAGCRPPSTLPWRRPRDPGRTTPPRWSC